MLTRRVCTMHDHTALGTVLTCAVHGYMFQFLASSHQVVYEYKKVFMYNSVCKHVSPSLQLFIKTIKTWCKSITARFSNPRLAATFVNCVYTKKVTQ
jgi:hypothetical protein